MPHKDPEKRKEYNKRVYRERLELQRDYNKLDYQSRRKQQIEYHRKYRLDHRDELCEKRRKYNQGAGKEIKRKNDLRKRIMALSIVSKEDTPKCTNCGCDDIRILEINHMNGGGTAERKNKIVISLINDVISGRRKTDDLDVRCKVCNWLHYVELKFGKLPFMISYKKREVGL